MLGRNPKGLRAVERSGNFTYLYALAKLKISKKAGPPLPRFNILKLKKKQQKKIRKGGKADSPTFFYKREGEFFNYYL